VFAKKLNKLVYPMLGGAEVEMRFMGKTGPLVIELCLGKNKDQNFYLSIRGKSYA
jgi:hypothetical protein